MPRDELFSPPGTEIGAGELRVEKARALADLLKRGIIPFVSFVEARRVPDGDVVVFYVDPEVPQLPAANIRRRERVAVVFFASDDRMPETIALRKDFPRGVPHLNLRPAVEPWVSLCLYEERYEDLKLTWTAAAYARRVHTWLSGTAQRTLHEPGQRLEPLIAPSAVPLAIPAGLLTDEWDAEAIEVLRAGDPQHPVLIVRRGADGPPGFYAIRVRAEPAVHGAIRHDPQNLSELHDLLASRGLNLASILRERLVALQGTRGLNRAGLVLVVAVPSLRVTSGPIERSDIFAFMSVNKTILDIGVALDVWQIQDGKIGRVLGSNADRRGGEIEIATLRPVLGLSRESAAVISGEEPALPRIAAVGAGMLGSQVITNLVRSGFGDWAVVDSDHMLPHNLVRHQLDGASLGFPKASAVSSFLNSLFDEVVTRSIDADVLRSPQLPELRDAFKNASVILDTSASATVARHLAIDVESSGRRMSLFLNPDGTDLVLLAEDERRETRLDDLEMQYYRAIVRRQELSNHLRPAGGRLRYGQSCRDVTVTIPQHRAAIAAGVGAAAVRQAIANSTPAIRMWRMTPDLEVRAVALTLATPFADAVGDWTVRTDGEVRTRLEEIRSAALPNETGGILVGHHDMQRKILYVVDALPAPPDSEGRPVFFTRGCEGLQQRVREIEAITAGALTYVGEWHSHPDGCSVLPSSDDDQVLAWITTHLEADGVPAVMSIVGRTRIAFYFANVRSPHSGASK